MASLLDPLSDDQKTLIDLVADAFTADHEWPIFDYIEGVLEPDGKDAAAILASFPRLGHWRYGAVWWLGDGNTLRPGPDTKITLTVLGQYRSQQLRQASELFLRIIELMLDQRRLAPLSRQEPRRPAISDELVKRLLEGTAWVDPEGWSLWIYKLIEREPSFTIGNVQPDGHWTKLVPPEITAYENVTTIEEYIARLGPLIAPPPTQVTRATASPFDLVGALDYLDAVWRATHKGHLFTYPSAERSARLTQDVTTIEQFDARLSNLGEILRSANRNVRMTAPRLPKASHDHPLASLEQYLVGKTGQQSKGRVRHAIADLEGALAIRDAAQHAEAADRAIRALGEFGIEYPIWDVNSAWATVSSRVIGALTEIREELAAAST